ncbi:cytochrome P450 [Amycolatopsis pigmentata]|uniref:Cytochrome P450 n=1 Tax=Amycolatopsis pigmentata TaxID=450801 RepID=A0ABW5G4W1_9PSEU
MTTETLPRPVAHPVFGHLGRWGKDPLDLLTEGAREGSVFELRLWRRALVGYRPEWNRAVLGDLETFRSDGSLSGLTPYLAGGVVHADVPRHDERRRELNPHFASRALAAAADTLREQTELPQGRFEALAWAGRTVRRMLNTVLFAGRLPDRLLAAFLAPLDQPGPRALVPRPLLFRRIEGAIARVVTNVPEGSLPAALAGTDGLVEELRIALAAGYDTTAHTLAWALWHLAGIAEWPAWTGVEPFIDEVLRLYPAGWLGSRVAAHDTMVTGVPIPAGTLVIYSPYLTHREPDLWPDPDRFRPGRPRPAWGYLPFAAGRRTCLGTHLARLMLHTALSAFRVPSLTRVSGNPAARTGITLRPEGPLWMEYR